MLQCCCWRRIQFILSTSKIRNNVHLIETVNLWRLWMTVYLYVTELEIKGETIGLAVMDQKLSKCSAKNLAESSISPKEFTKIPIKRIFIFKWKRETIMTMKSVGRWIRNNHGGQLKQTFTFVRVFHFFTWS